MIKFGTDGWRGIIGDDFTFRSLRLAAAAVGSYLKKKGGKSVVIGYDRRFLSAEFAQAAAEQVASLGLKVWLGKEWAPTPTVSFAVKELKAAGGVVITASHNPAIYNGFKFKEPCGGSAFPETIRLIEEEVRRITHRRLGAKRHSANVVERVDLKTSYISHLKGLLNDRDLKQFPLSLLVNPMHGATAGIFPRLFLNTAVSVMEINANFDPSFGGVCPEPIPENLGGMAGRIKRRRADLGLALDGDGDRLALMTERGEFVSSQKVFALILKHLTQNKGLRGGVVKTVSSTRMIDLLCEKEGLPLWETPIGFNHIAEKMLTEDILIGGEESGGIGVTGHLPERDGILAAILIVEMVTQMQKPLTVLLADLEAELGPFCYRRRDFLLSPAEMRRVRARLAEKPEVKVPGLVLVKINRLDGNKYLFADGSWLLLRPSGTEPVLRIYAESQSRGQVLKLIQFGAKQLGLLYNSGGETKCPGP